MLIASVNVASLLLVRSESRRREIAVRGALGATPARLSRQFITEGLALASIGCAAGVLVALWTIALLKGLVPKSLADGMPFLRDVGLHAHAGLFAFAVAVFVTTLMAATPVLRLSFQNIRDGLGDGNRSASGRFWRRTGANLVIVELAVAVVLLAGAGMLGKSFYRLMHVDTGIVSTHLATFQIATPENAYNKPEQLVALFREVTRRLSSLPGVESVGITTDLPIQCNCDTDWIRIVGKPFNGEHNEVNWRDVTPGYLSTLQAKLIRGRFLTEDDDASKPRKVVINEALAQKYFPGEDPIGKKIADGGLTPKSVREIVGVIANVREGGLEDEVWPAEYEAMYFEPDSPAAVVVRTAGDEKAALPMLLKAARGIDPNLGTYGEITMTDQINSTQSALLHRFSTWLVGGFAARGANPERGGTVWRDCLLGEPADAGDRRANGAGGAARLGLSTGDERSGAAHRDWRIGGTGWSHWRRDADGQAAFWGEGLGCGDADCCGVPARSVGNAGQLHFPARRAASVNPTEALRAE